MAPLRLMPSCGTRPQASSSDGVATPDAITAAAGSLGDSDRSRDTALLSTSDCADADTGRQDGAPPSPLPMRMSAYVAWSGDGFNGCMTAKPRTLPQARIRKKKKN